MVEQLFFLFSGIFVDAVVGLGDNTNRFVGNSTVGNTFVGNGIVGKLNLIGD